MLTTTDILDAFFGFLGTFGSTLVLLWVCLKIRQVFTVFTGTTRSDLE